MNNPTDNDASEQTGPDYGSGTTAADEVEMQRRFNELQSKLLNKRAAYIDRWLSVIAIVLTFFGIVAVVAGYISFERFRKIETEAREHVTASKQHAEEAQSLVEKIKVKRHEAESLVEKLNAETVGKNQEKAGEAAESVQDNPTASLLERAIAAAVLLQKQGEIEKAIEKWRAVARVTEGIDNDQAATAWFSVGYLLQDEDPKAGILAYNNAIRLQPDLAEAYNNRGNAKTELKQYKEAIVDYDETIRLQPDLAEAYNNRCNAKTELKQYKEAIVDCNEALRLQPGLAEAYSNRCNAKTKLKQYEKAIVDCNEALRLQSDLAEARNNRGNAKTGLKQYKEAVVDYNEALRLQPDYVEAYYDRGIAKKALGRKDEARKDFETALELARKTNKAKIVAQVEKMLSILGAAGGL